MMFNDTEAKRKDGKTGELYVYAVCTACSVCAAFLILMNGILVKSLPIFTSVFIQACFGIVYLICINYVVTEDYQFFSTDPLSGGLGIYTQDFPAVAMFSLSAGFFGNVGYVISLLFFSPVIVSAVFLFEPALGQLISYFAGIDEFPGWMTWGGTACVFLGILLIQRADR